eukprot:365473-Chlamydomonas_euryale.AAC.5
MAGEDRKAHRHAGRDGHIAPLRLRTWMCGRKVVWSRWGGSQSAAPRWAWWTLSSTQAAHMDVWTEGCMESLGRTA